MSEEPVRPAFGAPRLNVSVARGPLAEPVLTRAVGTFAARTELPAERLGDVAEVIGALTTSLPGGRISVQARADPAAGGLELHICDLPPGTARSVLSDVRHGGLARLIAVVADGVGVISSSRRGEALVVSFLPPR